MMLSMKIYCLMSLIGVLGFMNLFTSFMNYFIGMLVILSLLAVFIYPSLSLLGSWGVVDSMSVGLVLLSGFVTFLMIYSSYKVKRYNENYVFYYVLMVMLYFVLIFSFFTSDLLMFYFYFEVSLIPTLMIIIGWGYQPERLQAGVYFIFYTLFASLPLLIFINYIYYYWGGLNFFTVYLTLMKYNNVMTGLIMGGVALMGSLAFLVKLPVYFGHLWLPKAHVEAPVAGSMILAGVLLKLGGYGLMRALPFFYFFVKNFSIIVWGLGVTSMVYVGLLCVRLNDFKALVAYSSVAHMAMVICGLLSLYVWGWVGSFIMMISHGVSSSGLFCMVNLYYERTVSRSFYVNKGFLLVFPVFTLFLFLLAAANIAAPPTMNLVSEIFLMVSILSFDKFMLFVFPLGSFLGAVFSLFMFSYSQHGLIYYYVYSLTMPSFREYHTLVLHLIPVNFIFLNTSLFLLI